MKEEIRDEVMRVFGELPLGDRARDTHEELPSDEERGHATRNLREREKALDPEGHPKGEVDRPFAEESISGCTHWAMLPQAGPWHRASGSD